MHITDRNKGINKEMNYTLYRYSVILDKPNMYCTHNTERNQVTHRTYNVWLNCTYKMNTPNAYSSKFRLSLI